MFMTVARTQDAPRKGLIIGGDGKLIESVDMDMFRAASLSGTNYISNSMIQVMNN
jgi:hypothetical protein